MTYKSIFLSIAVMSLATSAWAIPNDNEYTQCMQSTSTDAGTTKCMEQEIIAVNKACSELEEKLNDIKANIDVAAKTKELKQMFAQYRQSYCMHYAKVRQGDGYSQEYHTAWCQMLLSLQYYRDLQMIYGVASTDIEG